MKILTLLFNSGLSREEIEKTAEERADDYRKVKGLVQKYYVDDSSTGRVGGLFVFDSMDNLLAFRESDLATSTGEAYKFREPPHTNVLDVAKTLFEK
ncbi:MAG: hypothetical protein ACW97A_13590 [Candidatus Thorarchaeota archaeon]|jgi:hypothetical protein